MRNHHDFQNRKIQSDNLELENKIIVQIKSYNGSHHNMNAVEQVRTGIEKYAGTAGMVITTVEKREALESKVQNVSDEIDCPIDLLAANDVAKFVIINAPELLFKLDGRNPNKIGPRRILNIHICLRPFLSVFSCLGAPPIQLLIACD